MAYAMTGSVIGVMLASLTGAETRQDAFTTVITCAAIGGLLGVVKFFQHQHRQTDTRLRGRRLHPRGGQCMLAG
jgi:uncharacterized membrane protein YfcA